MLVRQRWVLLRWVLSCGSRHGTADSAPRNQTGAPHQTTRHPLARTGLRLHHRCNSRSWATTIPVKLGRPPAASRRPTTRQHGPVIRASNLSYLPIRKGDSGRSSRPTSQSLGRRWARRGRPALSARRNCNLLRSLDHLLITCLLGR